MRLVMTLLVRDEEDILRANLEHHLAEGVDHVIVTDNLSVDGTRDILEEYVVAGVASVIDETDDDYDQSAWVTRMARIAADDLDAGWVIHNDADEFWFAPDGTVADHLTGQPRETTVVKAPRYDLIPLAGHDPWHERLVYRWSEPVRHDGSRLPGKVCHRGVAAPHVLQGNHHVDGPGLGPAVRTGLHILHAPIRTHEQMRRKVVQGAAAYERNTRVDERAGRQWRELASRVHAGTYDEWWRETVVPVERVRRLVDEGRVVRDDRVRRIVETVAAGVGS